MRALCRSLHDVDGGRSGPVDQIADPWRAEAAERRGESECAGAESARRAAILRPLDGRAPHQHRAGWHRTRLRVGFTSIVFFLWRLSGCRRARMPLRTSVFRHCWRASSGARVVTIRRPSQPQRMSGRRGRYGFSALWLSPLPYASPAGRLNHFVSRTPYGEWDGWAISNLRAAFLSAPTDHA